MSRSKLERLEEAIHGIKLEIGKLGALIGLINSIGNLGGFIGPSIVGMLLTRDHSYSFAVVFLSLGFFVASALTLLLRVPKTGAFAPRS